MSSEGAASFFAGAACLAGAVCLAGAAASFFSVAACLAVAAAFLASSSFFWLPRMKDTRSFPAEAVFASTSVESRGFFSGVRTGSSASRSCGSSLGLSEPGDAPSPE